MSQQLPPAFKSFYEQIARGSGAHALHLQHPRRAHAQRPLSLAIASDDIGLMANAPLNQPCFLSLRWVETCQLCLVNEPRRLAGSDGKELLLRPGDTDIEQAPLSMFG